jgi:hypothetical protein
MNRRRHIDTIIRDSINELYLHGNLEPSESDPRQTLSIYGFNGEGHYKFFMRVYNRIIDSIEIVEPKINVMYGINNLYINEFGRTKEGLFGLNLFWFDGDPRVDFKTFSESYTDYILRCCLELITEGLPNGGGVSITLTDMVLKYIYENVFENKILQRKFNLSESDERMDRFVDKVLQYLKDDTYEKNVNLIQLPFFDEPVSIRYGYHNYYTIIDVISFDDEPPKPFTHYCIETYGLDPQTINTVWDQYRVFLMDNFNKLKKNY